MKNRGENSRHGWLSQIIIRCWQKTSLWINWQRFIRGHSFRVNNCIAVEHGSSGKTVAFSIQASGFSSRSFSTLIFYIQYLFTRKIADTTDQRQFSMASIFCWSLYRNSLHFRVNASIKFNMKACDWNLNAGITENSCPFNYVRNEWMRWTCCNFRKTFGRSEQCNVFELPQ